jgi:hypothetical protein
MDSKFVQALNTWAHNDPDPKKTLELLAKKMRLQKKMVRTDPLGLLKRYYPEDYKGWLEEKKRLERIYALNRGFDRDKNFKHVWCIPQLIWDIDAEYWNMITRGKQYDKYPYFLVTNPLAKKTL